MTTSTDSGLPDFRPLWDFGNPAESETKFRALLVEVGDGADLGYRLEVETQIARTMGLRKMFEEAHEVLDAVEAALTPETKLARVRYGLERGRAFNSSGHPDRAVPLFAAAFDDAVGIGADGLAIDAAHMMGFVSSPEEQHRWNLKALEVAEGATDQNVRGWLGTLYHNIAMTYLEQGDFDRALSYNMKDYEFRLAHADQTTTRIAKWCVANVLRKMDRLDPALRMQVEMEKECAESGEPDGFVCEEIAEILLTRGKEDEARPYFRRAHAVLKDVDWVKESDPDRIDRLKMLGGEE
jgi:tetratricopeptide (TPR) repeat protein